MRSVSSQKCQLHIDADHIAAIDSARELEKNLVQGVEGLSRHVALGKEKYSLHHVKKIWATNIPFNRNLAVGSRRRIEKEPNSGADYGARLGSTMKGSSIGASDPTPLYEQVASEIRRAIADGEVQPGERMPLAKDLATVIGVNMNTVLRALRQLRDEGMLEFRRGRGITVTGTPERGAVVAKVRELVAFGRRHGYRPEELASMIQGIV